MPIDMRQFQAVFFAESREGLDAMESGLLSLESSGNNPDTINTIFRAAHSIKGGAATFGFSAITSTTHLLETLLDQVRAGKRAITPEISDVLLASVDVLRELLVAAEGGDAEDATPSLDLNRRLSAILDDAPAPAQLAATTAGGAAATKAVVGWKVTFAPHPNLFITGNDPLRILRELDRLGEMKLECDSSKLPDLDALEAATSYLSWTLQLPASVKQAAIADVFAWVEDECDLSIEPVEAAASPPAPATAPAPAPAPRSCGWRPRASARRPPSRPPRPNVRPPTRPTVRSASASPRSMP
jgi:two-component system, chemotaxis family, sensor kinase CheA